MNPPELNDDDSSNFLFYGTFEDLRANPEAETYHTRNIIYKSDETGQPDERNYSIATKHGPRKQIFMQFHKTIAVEQLVSPENQFMYSNNPELKTTIVDVDEGDIILITNTDPCITCADVERNDNNNFDGAHRMFYKCSDCEKFFSRISEYVKHLVKAVDYVCNSCGKRCPNYRKFLQHFVCHGNPERECSGCRKVLSNKYTLKRHMYICKKMLIWKLREFRKPPKTASNRN